MKNIIIIGANSFARLLYHYMAESGEREIAAFSVNSAYCGMGDTIFGKPVIPLEELQEKCPPEAFEVILAVGYSQMGKVRQRLAECCKKKGYFLASFIHSSAVISPSSELGEGNILLENVVVAPMAKVGHCNLIWNGVHISHECILGNYNTLSVSSALAGNVTIQNNCFLGVNSTVADHTAIADYTLVGAAGCVKRDTNPYDVIVPARSVTLEGKRSIEFL